MNKHNSKEIIYNKPVIKVIGLGGGGCNAVDRILSMGYGTDDVEFIAANTDLQALKRNKAGARLLIGPSTSGGQGSGGNPSVGEKAALESSDLIREALQGADIVFLTAGMGGGTGSGAISVAARIARELGAITISVVSTPFSFEAGRRVENARSSLMKLAAYSDTLITIPNDQILKVIPRDASIKNAFAYADDVLRQGITGITRLLSDTGDMNVDFAHIRNMMKNGGGSILTIGHGSGPDKVSNALYQALNHPLLEHLPIENATGIIANFIGNDDMTFSEVMEGLNTLQQLANYRADIIPGQVIDSSMKDEVQVILIITGIASMPIESLQNREDEEEYDDIPEDIEIHYAEAVEDEEEEPVEEEDIPQPVAVSVSQTSAARTVTDRIIPVQPGETPSFVSTPTTDAIFNSFMDQFGLTNTEATIDTLPENSSYAESRVDLDKPAFIRRRM